MKHHWLGVALTLLCLSALAEEPAAYVSLGSEGQALARVVTPDNSCPALEVNGKSIPMQLRVEPRQNPLSDKRPALFMERVCELPLPATAKQVKLMGQALPRIHPHPHKIVLLGDTGCRMKLPTYFQDCSDPAAWPLAQVAKQATLEKPDLVIHVGDYHYRENSCLAGDCAHTPTGYGSDTWQLDFFKPMKPLLEAAPWIFVRGNHESCERAGQGWFRYLDPRPYSEQQNCDHKTPAEADITEPYAVPLSPTLQLIVMDTAAAADAKAPPALVQAYSKTTDQVIDLTQHKPQSWLVMHHPLLGYAYGNIMGYYSSNATLLAAWKARNYPGLLPDSMPFIIEGHFHAFELNRFTGQQPLSLITGFSGSALEPEYPKTLPNHFEVAPGIEVAESLHSHDFGYTVLEEVNGHWILLQKDRTGKTQLTCNLQLQNTNRTFQCH